MDEFDEIKDFIAPDKLDAFKEIFPKHFGRTANVYGKFDNAAKELGIEKPEGVSTLDHFTTKFQELKKASAEKELALSEAQKQLNAFGDKSKSWEESQKKLKASFDLKQQEVSEKISKITDSFLLKSAKTIKLAEPYASDADLHAAKMASIKANYQFEFVDGDIVPTKDGQRVLLDGKALTVEDILNNAYSSYIAKDEIKKDDFEHKKVTESSSLSPSAACRAAGKDPSSQEGRAFVIEYAKKLKR